MEFGIYNGIAFTLHRGELNEIVVISHGLMDNRLQYPLVPLSKMLNSLGYNVIRFDFRGCGESEGMEEKYSLSSMEEDLREIYNFSREIGEKVYLIAKSISGIPGLKVFSDGYYDKFIGLGTPYDLRRKVSEDEIKIAEEKGYIFYKGNKYGKKLIREYLDYPEKFSEFLTKINKPVLLVYGTEDSNFRSGEAYKLFSEIGGRDKRLVEIAGAGHSFKERETFLYQLFEVISEFLSDEAEDS